MGMSGAWRKALMMADMGRPSSALGIANGVPVETIEWNSSRTTDILQSIQLWLAEPLKGACLNLRLNASRSAVLPTLFLPVNKLIPFTSGIGPESAKHL
jgi:hypothetical protein